MRLCSFLMILMNEYGRKYQTILDWRSPLPQNSHRTEYFFIQKLIISAWFCDNL